MNYDFPDLTKVTTIEAICWYTKQVVVISKVKNQSGGTYSKEYREALLSWKEELNVKALEERKSFYNAI
ncbi:hypothetical protein [Rossellomorea sp. NRS-1567]|uniref:hypothetical protein n=1 Tax=Rossellomorea sp. NRS-1567 TaxID=3233901 RepID=UPI003D2D4D28